MGVQILSQESEEAKAVSPGISSPKPDKVPPVRSDSQTKSEGTSALDDGAVKSVKRDQQLDVLFENEQQELESSYIDEEPYEKDARYRSDQNSCYSCMYSLVTSVSFNFFIFLLIIANTMTLALYSYDQSETKAFILSICNEFFTWAFFLEMIFKIIGLGAKNYVQDPYNKFDAIVVIVSLIDWTISRAIPPELLGSFGDALNAFRALRLLRVIKLARLWGALAKIL